MAGEKKIGQSESVDAGLESNISSINAKVDVAPVKAEIPRDTSLISSDASTTVKKDQNVVSEQGAYYQPTPFYNNYFYPGFNSSLSQTANYSPSNGAYTGVQSDAGALYYNYSPYVNYSGVDGSGYYQTYGADSMQGCYPFDLSYGGDYRNGNRTGVKSNGFNSNVSVKSNGYKTNKTVDMKNSTLPLDMKSRQSAPVSNLSKPIMHSQPLKQLNKMSPSYHSTALVSSFPQVGRYPSSFTNPGRSYYSQMNYRPNSRVWSGNDRFRMGEKFNRNGDFEASNELTRGPRVQNQKNPATKLSAEDEQKLLGPIIGRDQINLEDFPTEYDDAKFYVIKSYSEDDVHKCVKYGVWSSTPNGNKKLHATYNEIQTKISESGKKCPIFFFFSVNRSGQFVGVAEMAGPVDFGKNMDFWQMDKWTGFFPVKWHIVKDIPNSQLRHIILENNDNRDVTYTRDTQDIQLKQGLEMLSIFKSYPEKTSVLDDFNFYEERENLLKAKRISNLQKVAKGGDITNENGAVEEVSSPTASSLIDLTRNLSLNPIAN
jgi:hypothetical protein